MFFFNIVKVNQNVQINITYIRPVIICIAPAGLRILADLKKGTRVNILDNIASAKTPDDFVAPKRKELPKKAPRAAKGTGRVKASTAAPRTGTAASRALTKFKSMVDSLERIPTRAEFMQVLMAAPFNMGKSGAQTYYYTTKGKYAALNEAFSAQASWELLIDPTFRSFKSFLIG